MEIKKKYLIYYFSGTGNSKNVAQWIKDEISDNDYQCDIINIAKTNREDISIPDKNTIIGFVSPTHGFNYPPIMIRFLWNFPKGKNNFFTINTRAGLKISKGFIPGLSGITHMLAFLILWLKGYHFQGARPIDLPSNWISIHPGLGKEVVKSIHYRCERISRDFANKIISNKKVYRACYDIIQDLLISPIAIGYYIIGRFILSKTYIASKDCDMCGLCFKECPVNAIKEVDNRPYWTLSCESCMRCVNNCPKRAIETPHGILFILLSFAFAFVMQQIYFFISTYIEVINDYQILTNEWFRITFESALLIPFLLLSYYLMHFLLKIHIFERLIIYTSLTHFSFWRRYKALKTIYKWNEKK